MIFVHRVLFDLCTGVPSRRRLLSFTKEDASAFLTLFSL